MNKRKFREKGRKNIFGSCKKNHTTDKDVKEGMIHRLKRKYWHYAELATYQAAKSMEKLLPDKTITEVNFEFLISFDDKINWVCQKRLIGKPDSFIIAACLLYSILDNPVVKIEGKPSQNLEYINYAINLEIAMNCVFEIISEPITYYQEFGEWIEERYPKVDIVVPDGIIEGNSLYKRITDTIYQDDLINQRSSIMQTSNLLHLIYLSSQ